MKQKQERRVDARQPAIGAAWIMALAASVAVASARPQEQPTVGIEELADNVYLYTYNAHRSLFVANDDGVLVTDPQSPEAAQRYVQEIQSMTAAPIRFLVYSHHHGDHVSGGAAFGNDVVIVAHDNLPENVAAESAIAAPTITFTDEASIYLADLEVRLLYPGPSETDSSIIVFVPERRVAFMVDAVSVRTVPWRNLAGANPHDWTNALRMLNELDFDILAPGHGPTGDKSHVAEYIQYMTDLTAAVQQRIDQGQSLEQIQATLELPQYADWVRYDQHFRLNIEGVFRELAR